MAVQFLLPTAPQIETKKYNLALDGAKKKLRIGMLANGFPEGHLFLSRLANALDDIIPDAEYRIETKGTTDQLSACVPEPLLSSMAAECDAVVIAWGHCGSCTSGVTRDAIAFAQRGIPSVTLICEIFWDYSYWIGSALGMEDLPKVRIPYPVAGTGEANQRELARQIAPQIMASLTGTRH